MGWFIDIKGKKYNFWRVLEKTENRDRGGSIMWKCKCDCGTVREVSANSLRNGASKSCGCFMLKNKTEPDIKVHVKYTLSDEVCFGYTTNTKQKFYFDRKDYNKIKKYSWYEDAYGYVLSSTYKMHGDTKATFLHELITGFSFDGVEMIDHIDGNGFNNVRGNLRIVSYSQNSMNTAIRSDNKSGCKGVSYNKKGSNWYSRISREKNEFSLGFHKNKLDAIRHREVAELYLFNEYSREHEELKDKYKTTDVVGFLKQHHPKIIEKFPSETF